MTNETIDGARGIERGIEQTNDGRANQAIIIDNGKALWAVAGCAALSGVACALAYFAFYTASQAAMESRLQTQHVMKLEAQLEAQLEAANAKR